MTQAVDWASLVRAGDQVVCSHMTGEPVFLLLGLAAAALDVPFDVTLGVPFSMAAAALPAATLLTTFGGMGTAGALSRTHRLRISPVPYSRCGGVYESGQEAANLVLVSLVRGSDGRLLLAGSHGYILEAARRARHVIAEVNAQAPCIQGAPWPVDVRIDQVVEVDYPLSVAASSLAGEVESAIAAHVAALVPDGACLQVGIGAMPSAVLQALAAHRALGLHSGMLTDAVRALIESGAMDHSRKPEGSRFGVTGCVYGSASLYRFCDRHPALSLREPAFTHGAQVIAQLSDFVAINSAIEVDLLGQANAESVVTAEGSVRQIGGVGGLNDFVRASRLAPRGRAVIALASRAGASSRIVARLGGPATVSACDADVMVTEYGVAHLRDATLDQRAARMLAIAHPDDRDLLERQAHAMGLSPAG
jgi:acyl-CoA hydrolase